MSRSVSSHVLSIVFIAVGGYMLLVPVQNLLVGFFVDIRTQLLLGFVLLGLGVWLQLKK